MSRLSKMSNHVLILVLAALVIVLGVQVGWVAQADQGVDAAPPVATSEVVLPSTPDRAFEDSAAVGDVPATQLARASSPVMAARDGWAGEPDSASVPGPSSSSADKVAPRNERAPRSRDKVSRSVENDAGSSAESRPNGAKSVKQCRDPLVRLLFAVGFRGENIREAWAIAMRESRGQADLGPGHPQYNGSDMGLFQWNRPTWGNAPWWDEKRLLDGRYNASIVFKMSKGGQYWLPWGLTGNGQLDASHYVNIWSPQQIQSWIWEPYSRFHGEFAGLPAGCLALTEK